MAGELAYHPTSGQLIYSPATGQLALDCIPPPAAFYKLAPCVNWDYNPLYATMTMDDVGRCCNPQQPPEYPPFSWSTVAEVNTPLTIVAGLDPALPGYDYGDPGNIKLGVSASANCSNPTISTTDTPIVWTLLFDGAANPPPPQPWYAQLTIRKPLGDIFFWSNWVVWDGITPLDIQNLPCPDYPAWRGWGSNWAHVWPGLVTPTPQCPGGAAIYTNTNLLAYVGKAVMIYGVCYFVTQEGDHSDGAVVVQQSALTCAACCVIPPP